MAAQHNDCYNHELVVYRPCGPSQVVTCARVVTGHQNSFFRRAADVLMTRRVCYAALLGGPHSIKPACPSLPPQSVRPSALCLQLTPE